MAKAASESAVLGLVDGIYDAGLAVERWPSLLTRLADTFGARDAALGTIGPPGLAWMCAPRTDPDFLRIYPERYHALNDAWHRIVQRGVGAATTDQMVIDRREFHGSLYYHEWAKPQGYRTVIGGLIDAEHNWRTVLTLPGRADYGRDSVRLFGVLSAHIRRAVQLNRHLDRANIDRAALRQTVERMSGAAFLVDAEARIVVMNEMAEKLLRADRGLRVTRGRLGAGQRAHGVALRTLIAQSVLGGLPDRGSSIEVTSAVDAPLKLLLIPLHHPSSRHVPGAPATLIVEASAPTPRDGAQRLALTYGLTDAEARFAEEILKGDGKRAAAERCGISYSTARSHLSRIFEKTGVHRQAALVRLLKP